MRGKLRRLTPTTIEYLEYLIEKYGDRFPRRTEIASFEAVDVRAVSRQNIRVAYDPTTGFFGSSVKGDKFQLDVTEYDKILLVSRDGSYRIIGPEDKVLIPKVIYCKVFDPEQGAAFTVVYRDRRADRLWQEGCTSRGLSVTASTSSSRTERDGSTC